MDDIAADPSADYRAMPSQWARLQATCHPAGPSRILLLQPNSALTNKWQACTLLATLRSGTPINDGIEAGLAPRWYESPCTEPHHALLLSSKKYAEPMGRRNKVKQGFSTHARISAIAALDENHVIGRADGRLPWRIPEDSRRFRKLTMGHPVIMGRRTYESIGKPLDGRANIIITRDVSYEAPGCLVVHSLDAAITLARIHDDQEIFIGGGEQIYKAALPLCDRLYLTLVDGHFEGTAKFPHYSQFQELVEKTAHDDGTHRYIFVTLEA
jgi:dihydrofolate reductase